MATFYPNSSSQLDGVPTQYIHDQKFTPYSESPMIQGNLMMYLNEIGPATSMSNGVEIPSMVGRNEMMFIPPTGDQLPLQEMSDPVDGERSLQLHSLSLSLSTQLSTAVQPPPFQHFSKDLSDSAYGPYDFVRFGAPNNLQYAVNPKGEDYNTYQYDQVGAASSVMKSKYLKATQQLLDEIVNVRDALKQHDSAKDQNLGKAEDKPAESKDKSAAESDANESTSAPSQELSATERQELQNKLDKLLTMLDEVDRRYKQYNHQMQIMVSSFDLVAGNGAAKAYTTLAMKTISRHFRSLRDAISGQVQTARKSLGEQDSGPGGVIPRLRFVDQQIRQQRALQQFGMMRHAWRPQRGLPENAVTALRAWLFEHFLHPYPKDSEKIMLARQTGLTRSQVANWFINARVRLWKPMIEDMYKEEFGEADLNLRSSPEDATKASEGPSHDESKTSIGLMDHHFYQHDDHNGLMSFQASELGSYGVDNQVTLALGLRRVDGDVGHLPDDTTLRPGASQGNAIASGTNEYSYFGPINPQHKFGNSHLLNDFVV